MQVRAIEFQESFARVPVEQGRQQHVLMREPDLARDQTARIAADQNLLNLSRPGSTTETEGVIVDPEGHQASQRRSSQRPRRAAGSPEPKDETEIGVRTSDGHIDLIA